MTFRVCDSPRCVTGTILASHEAGMPAVREA